MELPSDSKLTFEGAETGDPVKDAVLADNAERMCAVDAAVAGTDPEGKAAEAAVSWVGQFERANATVTGQVRSFDREVEPRDKTSAVLTFRADESKGFSKDKKTGKVAKTPVTEGAHGQPFASTVHALDRGLTEAVLFREDLGHLVDAEYRVVPNSHDGEGGVPKRRSGSLGTKDACASLAVLLRFPPG
ncbi:hypothetical protein AB0D47_12985 [Streptomyces sp. NPDC048376]|uniref:hypothetical protein n=1 Tax=Streptomyces sp. NPDC048376 TaxID=3154926 RepID=UPI003413DEDD